jgi:sugar O-acyltransferase (sialic acid O-acetyltransferase NeuD family)
MLDPERLAPNSPTATIHSSRAATGSAIDRRVVVIGAGGHGKVTISALQAMGITVAAVYDDNSSRWGQQVLGVQIHGPISALADCSDCSGVVGIGDNRIRQKLVEALPLDWLTVIHPFSYVHPTVTIGKGSVVMAGSVIQPDVVIGTHCIVNTVASVDHDCWIGDFSAIGPGTRLSGGVRLGNRCMLGTGCSVLPGITVEDDVVVGAGTVVICDLEARSFVVGTGLRTLRRDGGSVSG